MALTTNYSKAYKQEARHRSAELAAYTVGGAGRLRLQSDNSVRDREQAACSLISEVYDGLPAHPSKAELVLADRYAPIAYAVASHKHHYHGALYVRTPTNAQQALLVSVWASSCMMYSP